MLQTADVYTVNVPLNARLVRRGVAEGRVDGAELPLISYRRYLLVYGGGITNVLQRNRPAGHRRAAAHRRRRAAGHGRPPAIFGIPVTKSLSAGGFQDPTSESAQATQLLTDKFGQGDMQLLITVTVARAAPRAPRRAAVGTDIVDAAAGARPTSPGDVGMDRAAAGRRRHWSARTARRD